MHEPLIIAEVGINHNGSLKNAKKYIDILKKIDVDIVKFQIAVPENVTSIHAKKSKYQINKKGESQLEMISKYHLNVSENLDLIDYAKKNNVRLMFSAFDKDSLKIILENKYIKDIKIPSGEITNYQLLNMISKSNKKLFMSTGMSNISEIKKAIETITNGNLSKYKNNFLLQCTSSYPTQLKDVNLNMMNYLKDKFKCKIGFSDHTLNDVAAQIAVALGAECIEKHVTLDNNMDGPDHKMSLNIKNFKNFVINVRNVNKILGLNVKKKVDVEIENSINVRKSVHAKIQISKGDVFTNDNLCLKRPGIGIKPKNFNKLIGKRSKYNFKKDDIIKL